MTALYSRCFQPGGGHSRCFLHDCVNRWIVCSSSSRHDCSGSESCWGWFRHQSVMTAVICAGPSLSCWRFGFINKNVTAWNLKIIPFIILHTLLPHTDDSSFKRYSYIQTKVFLTYSNIYFYYREIEMQVNSAKLSVHTTQVYYVSLMAWQ